MAPQRLIEVLAEYSLALWNANDAEGAFKGCEEAVLLLFACENSDPYWKKLFLALFGTVVYLSNMAYFGRLPNVPKYEPPRQGLFLGLDNIDFKSFTALQTAQIRIRMSLFAEGIGRSADAGRWAKDALAVADQIPAAKGVLSLAWLNIVPAILADNFGEATQAALLMADSRAADEAVLEESGFKERDTRRQIQELSDHPGKERFAMMLLATSVVFRLAVLQLKGYSSEEILSRIEAVAGSKPDDVRIQQISTALREALLEPERRWQDLRARAEELMPSNTGLGLIYYVASALRRPMTQALHVQTWLAEMLEKLTGGFVSLRREIIWPFFGSFWLDAVSKEQEHFRTGENYTRRALGELSRSTSVDDVKQLLSSMSVCLGLSLSDRAGEWLRSGKGVKGQHGD
jgi:hypothetical protein